MLRSEKLKIFSLGSLAAKLLSPQQGVPPYMTLGDIPAGGAGERREIERRDQRQPHQDGPIAAARREVCAHGAD